MPITVPGRNVAPSRDALRREYASFLEQGAAVDALKCIREYEDALLRAGGAHTPDVMRALLAAENSVGTDTRVFQVHQGPAGLGTSHLQYGAPDARHERFTLDALQGEGPAAGSYAAYSLRRNDIFFFALLRVRLLLTSPAFLSCFAGLKVPADAGWDDVLRALEARGGAASAVALHVLERCVPRPPDDRRPTWARSPRGETGVLGNIGTFDPPATSEFDSLCQAANDRCPEIAAPQDTSNGKLLDMVFWWAQGNGYVPAGAEWRYAEKSIGQNAQAEDAEYLLQSERDAPEVPEAEYLPQSEWDALRASAVAPEVPRAEYLPQSEWDALRARANKPEALVQFPPASSQLDSSGQGDDALRFSGTIDVGSGYLDLETGTLVIGEGTARIENETIYFTAREIGFLVGRSLGESDRPSSRAVRLSGERVARFRRTEAVDADTGRVRSMLVKSARFRSSGNGSGKHYTANSSFSDTGASDTIVHPEAGMGVAVVDADRPVLWFTGTLTIDDAELDLLTGDITIDAGTVRLSNDTIEITGEEVEFDDRTLASIEVQGSGPVFRKSTSRGTRARQARRSVGRFLSSRIHNMRATGMAAGGIGALMFRGLPPPQRRVSSWEAMDTGEILRQISAMSDAPTEAATWQSSDTDALDTADIARQVSRMSSASPSSNWEDEARDTVGDLPYASTGGGAARAGANALLACTVVAFAVLSSAFSA